MSSGPARGPGGATASPGEPSGAFAAGLSACRRSCGPPLLATCGAGAVLDTSGRARAGFNPGQVAVLAVRPCVGIWTA